MKLVALAASLFLSLAASAQQEAAPAMSAEAGWDEETGLWFPPWAPKDVYLSGTDREHVYVLDVKKAFEADEELRKSVCERMTSRREERNVRQVGPRVMQLHTMVDMVCIGVVAQRQQDEDQARVDRENAERWRSWLDIPGARALEWDERRVRAYAAWDELHGDGPVKSSDDRLRLALSALALQPHDDVFVAEALGAFPYPDALPWPRYVRFLDAVLSEEASEGKPEAPYWRMGLRSFAYYTGDFARARALTREVLAHPFLPGHTYDAIFLALLGRLQGDATAFPALLADCPVSPARAVSPDEPKTAWCWQVARPLAIRGIERLGAKAPAALADLLAESIAAEPTNWPSRLDAIRAIGRVDRPRARVEIEKLLAVPATLAPEEARFDAVAELAVLARADNDFRRGLAAYDRYLDLAKFHPPKPMPDVWKRLAAAAEPPLDDPHGEDHEGHHFWWALGGKIDLAVGAGDLALARRTTETFAAAALERHVSQGAELAKLRKEAAEAGEETAEEFAEAGSLLDAELARAAGQVRYRLVMIARAELAAGRRPAAIRIVSYLYSQPHQAEGDHVVTNLSSLKMELANGGPVELTPVASPWDAAAR